MISMKFIINKKIKGYYLSKPGNFGICYLLGNFYFKFNWKFILSFYRLYVAFFFFFVIFDWYSKIIVNTSSEYFKVNSTIYQCLKICLANFIKKVFSIVHALAFISWVNLNPPYLCVNKFFIFNFINFFFFSVWGWQWPPT